MPLFVGNVRGYLIYLINVEYLQDAFLEFSEIIIISIGINKLFGERLNPMLMNPLLRWLFPTFALKWMTCLLCRIGRNFRMA